MPKAKNKSAKNTVNKRNAKGQFTSGNTEGNRNGRPLKKQTIPDILLRIGMQPGTKDGKMTKLDVVMERVFKFAVEGRPWAVEFIANRTEGKPRQQIDINLSDKRPVFDGKNPNKFLNEYIHSQNAQA